MNILSMVRDQTGLDVIQIYNNMPTICVYAFEHMWLCAQGADCKRLGVETTDDLIQEMLSS